MSEIPLHATSKERRHLEDLADLYAIIKATEHLEKAYARDLVGAEEVRLNPQCTPPLSISYP